jgi:hypothetical protein
MVCLRATPRRRGLSKEHKFVWQSAQSRHRHEENTWALIDVQAVSEALAQTSDVRWNSRSNIEWLAKYSTERRQGRPEILTTMRQQVTSMQDETIYFCVPLIGMLAAKNWDHVTKLFDQTLLSVLTQKGNLKVLVAGNDIPASRFIDDSRLEFLNVRRDVPRTWREKIHDKTIKLRRLVEEVCERGGGYVVTMDADDLLSNRLVRHIALTDNKTGYIFQSGYLFNVAGKQFRMVHDFSNHCGTCAVFYLGENDLTPGSGVCAIIENGKHTEYAKQAELLGRKLEAVPFPAAIYLRHHGGNVSLERKSGPRFRNTRNLIRRLVGRSYISDGIRSEFSVPNYY